MTPDPMPFVMPQRVQAALANEETRHLVREAIASCGPVTLNVADLVEDGDFLFEHPLFEQVVALSDHLKIDREHEGQTCWGITDDAWRRLVITYLLPRLPVPVTLERRSNNSAWARYVDGRPGNADALRGAVGPSDVAVTGAQVAAALLATCDGTPLPSEPPRQSLPSEPAGPGGFTGRSVVVDMIGGSLIEGYVLAENRDTLVLSDNPWAGVLQVVFLRQVHDISTDECTDQDRILDDLQSSGPPVGVSPDAEAPAGADGYLHDDGWRDQFSLADVWAAWQSYRKCTDPVSQAFALGDFANTLHQHVTEQLGPDAVT